MGIFRNKIKKETNNEYFDVRELLEQVQTSEDWVSATFITPQDDMDDELIYYNSKLNLAFKFIIDEATNTVGMKKVDPQILEIKGNKKGIH